MVSSLSKTLILYGLFAAFAVCAPTSTVFAATTLDYHLVISPGMSVPQGGLVSISLSPKNFIVASTTFSWYRASDNTLLDSGLGKNTYSFRAPNNLLGLYAIRFVVDAGPEYDVKEEYTGVVIFPPSTNINGGTFGSIDISAISANFSLSSLPKTPSAGDRVTVSASSFSFNTRDATFSWYLDGAYKAGDSGRGKGDFSFTAGKTGSVHTVRADVLLLDGTKNSKSVELRVLSTHFYWWANSYTPYWYKGKALPGAGSRVGVMLLSEGNLKGLGPRWSLDDEIDNSQKTNVYYYTTRPAGTRNNISVELVTSSSDTMTQATLTITPQRPRIGVYVLHPLQGILYNRLIDSSFVGSGAASVDIIAEPFYFDGPSFSMLEYSWRANFEKLLPENDSRPEVLTITTDGPSQSFPVTVDVTNTRDRSNARSGFQFNSQ